MPDLANRISKLESSHADKARYLVSWTDGSTTTEREIVKLLGICMQSDHGGILEITPRHHPPYSIIEKLASWYLEQQTNKTKGLNL